MVAEHKATLETRVRIALIENDMTQTDLANELGISASYLSDLLKQKRTGSKAQERIKTMKKYLNIF
ncbi:helix-turn-helix domain-containing protein [Marinilactibacillus sp. GCM10026970]|uniref:helix-turn-helix domain-containing protein n=1 Tax=Marinilactibacillus sp. GCM10026970 TaxID=3252642 RepID=UPI00360C0659